MSNSLKTNYLFNGRPLTVNEVSHEQNLDLESDWSPSDLKKNQRKISKWFLKYQLSNRNRVFFIVNFPMRQKLAF